MHDTRGKKICMIAYTKYSTDARVRRTAETLAAAGYSVTMLALAEGASPRNYLHYGVRVKELRIRKYRGHSSLAYILSYVRFMILSFLACSAGALRLQVDMVHVHNMPDFLVFSALVPKLLGKRIVLDIHDSMLETYGSRFDEIPVLMEKVLLWEERISSRFADRIVCVNHVQSLALLKRGIESVKLHVLLNVPDERVFTPGGRVRSGSDGGRFNLVYHGTLDRGLGIDRALHAVDAVRGVLPGVHFHILGTGKDAAALIRMRQELGIEEYVTIRNRMLLLEALPEFLETKQLGVIPNRRNRATEMMLPVKMIEYISLGIPVIAPRLAAIEYYFSDEMLTFFDPDRTDSMAAAILEVHDSYGEAMRKAGNALRFLEQYGWNRHKEDLFSLYASLALPTNRFFSRLPARAAERRRRSAGLSRPTEYSQRSQTS